MCFFYVVFRYIKTFNLENHLCLNSNIESTRQLPNKKWQVTWTNYLTGKEKNLLSFDTKHLEGKLTVL